MIRCTDGLGREVILPHPARRIVSLVPSQTELLHYFGLERETVGITKFCIHPESWFRQKPRVGGTKNVHIDQVIALQPDLVIANEEENVKEQVEALAKHCPVYVSVVNNLEEALQMIEDVGRLTHKDIAAQELAASIQQSFPQKPQPVHTAAYLIWKDPYMTVGGDTFIHDMMGHAGFSNVFADRNRYPAVTMEDLVAAAPDVVLLSSEPYPFKEKERAALQDSLPHSTVLLVDGEVFSWYGSRLLHAPPYYIALRERLRNAQ